MRFTSLHNHTYCSNLRMLDSINRPEEMVEKAIRLGFSGMAFTDHECLSIGVSLLHLRDKIKQEHPDFKIIFGNEIYLINDTEVRNTNKYYHFILLAKDEIGWQQLKELSSRAWLRGYVEKRIMRVPTTYQDIEEVVGKNRGHLIASTACLGGKLPYAILNKDAATINWFIPWMINNFGRENVCLEMQPSDNEEQVLVNKYIVKLSKHFNLRTIVTTDSHYLNKEDFGIHSAFLNSKLSSDRETEKFYKYTYVMELDEIRELLSQGGIPDEEIDKAIDNTDEVCSMIGEFDFRHSTIIPAIQLPQSFELKHLLKDWYDSCPIIKHYAYSKYPQDRYLLYQIENGIIDKGVSVDKEKADRINTELDVVLFISKRLEQDVSAYLNLAVDMINIAWNASLVGCGRGSSCGFYINYLIGITQVDPLKYNLPYWRFLNKERAEMPDIDTDYQPEKTEEIIELFRKEYGDDNVLNCATFKTESLKSAILTCMRGLNYNNDDAQALAALVPSHRGKTYTLNDCLYGNEEQGFEPVTGFENKLRQYDGLFDAVKKIEGLPTNASIHASALYIFNGGYLAHNSLMRAPNKTRITAFNMHDSDDQGALKMDVLRTDAQSKMAKCLDLLLKAGEIEWQGSLRKTYNKYLHPDVLDYTNEKMWEDAANGKISNLFQFETQVGGTCIKKARPTNVTQLAEINSIMRLQVEGDEQPIDRYVKFRNDINLWYQEMRDSGLNQEEIDLLDKYLKNSFGISGSQETLMLLVMDPKITGFTLGEANKFRKAISKKIAADIQLNKEKYFEYGAKLGTRQCFLDYVWKYCVEPQLGYSFSLNHTLPYSVIAVQEMNLATRWNILYWVCACLCVNAGNYVGEIGDDEEDDEYPSYGEDPEEEEESEENVQPEAQKAKRVAPNYGKIAKAVSDAQREGVKIELPYINEAQEDFVPDIENNSIIYSLQALNCVSDDLLEKIITLRPFKSIGDFMERVLPTTVQMVGLIKAGCFDKLYPRNSRRQIMSIYLQLLANLKVQRKTKMTLTQVRQALDLGLELTDFKEIVRMYRFKQYIDKNQLSPYDSKCYLLTEDTCLKYFHVFIEKGLNRKPGRVDYEYHSATEIHLRKAAFKAFFDEFSKPLLLYLGSPEGIEAFYRAQQKAFTSEIEEKYCSGSIAAWEMETMCCYYGEHELQNVNNDQYKIVDFNKLPEYPKTELVEENGRTYQKHEISAIAGTVISNDNTRHTVTILTLYGAVTVKLYRETYALYNKRISVVDKETGKKTTIEDPWFKRGKKILVYGYRKENLFCAKKSGYGKNSRLLCLINEVKSDGSLDVSFSRKKA